MAWSDIPGWFSFGFAYDEMVETAKDGDVIVEVGVAFGRSVAYLARKVIDSGKDITIYAVDPWLPRWDDHPKYPERLGWGGEHAALVKDCGGPFNSFLHCMRTHAPAELERINVLRTTSAMASTMIESHNLSVYGVLIDGSHHYDDVKNDIDWWIPTLCEGGILAGDDWSETEFPGVCQAVREHFGPGTFEVKGTTWIARL